MLARDVRFNVDEALYATFSRRIALHSDFLLSNPTDVMLDKPPLGLLLTAASDAIFGPTEFAARLPNVLVSILDIALLIALARRLYGWRVAILAGLLLAFSPLDLAFAATNFLDPLLTFWLLLATLAAVRDRWGIAGIACALGIATKQSAVFYLPLIVALGAVQSLIPYPSHIRSRLLRFAGFLLFGLILLALWSVARAAPVDFWTLGAYNNDPGRFIRANEIMPRLNEWLSLLGAITGFSPLLLLACVPLFAALSANLSPSHRTILIDRLLAAVLIAILLGYWLIAFNIYDRYLLPVGPLVLLLVARGVSRLGRIMPGLMVLIVALMLPFTANVLFGRTTLGSNDNPYAGIDNLATVLNALPTGSTVYDYSLDWELGFYLGDMPATKLIWQPTPQALARAVCDHPDSEQAYFATPATDSEGWLWALRKVGGGAQLLTGTQASFRLYRLDCGF